MLPVMTRSGAPSPLMFATITRSWPAGAGKSVAAPKPLPPASVPSDARQPASEPTVAPVPAVAPKVVEPPAPVRIDTAKIQSQVNRALASAGLGSINAIVSEDMTVVLNGNVRNAGDKNRAKEVAETFVEKQKVRDKIFIVE